MRGHDGREHRSEAELQILDICGSQSCAVDSHLMAIESGVRLQRAVHGLVACMHQAAAAQSKVT